MPMALIMLLSNWPARPTKGSPCTSSSAPGPSPTNIKSAQGLPTPKTICLRPCLCSLQRVQSPRSSRISLSAAMGSALPYSGFAVTISKILSSAIVGTTATFLADISSRNSDWGVEYDEYDAEDEDAAESPSSTG